MTFSAQSPAIRPSYTAAFAFALHHLMPSTPSFASIAHPLSTRTVSKCTCSSATRWSVPLSRRKFTTSSIQNTELNVEREGRPRWQQTPEKMVAPFRARPRPLNNQYVVNEDPRKLDQVYTKLLGNGGEKMLTEEVKWLAVTHKSFDHGRRGYNDRLAFLGKRIVELQTSLGLIHSRLNAPASVTADQYGRTPFQHPALDGLEGLNQTSRAEMIECARVAGVAERYGLLGVIRWKPRKADGLITSGVNLVLSQALYAVVGAVALEKGGEVANRIARERILSPMGLSS